MFDSLTLRPIGLAHTPFADKVSAPRQPAAALGVPGVIELFAGHNYEEALEDLREWDRIWVLFWFHLNTSWRPKVLPPRSERRRGVFSTRSPHRPNPIGMSVLRLKSIEGLRLHVLDVDIVDNTPILDIKPYVAYADAHPEATSGWLGSDNTIEDPDPGYEVRFSDRALAQAVWIHNAGGPDLHAAASATLSLGPQPHAYRRIKREGASLCLAIKDWRVRFQVEGRVVSVESIGSGYRPKQLAQPDTPTLALHARFNEVYAR